MFEQPNSALIAGTSLPCRLARAVGAERNEARSA
jgi:hypothetical protein